jgi:hypothetical protein
MCRSFNEFVSTLDRWAELGVVVHLCDVPIGPLDPESTPFRLVIDVLVLFNGSESRRIATRCRQVADSLRAEGRRYTRFAPFGFKWEERGRFTVLVPEPIEQRLCIQAAEMRLQGYSWHQIRRYFAYEWRVRNRKGNQFGFTEIRKLTFRGLELLRAAESPHVDSSRMV